MSAAGIDPYRKMTKETIDDAIVLRDDIKDKPTRNPLLRLDGITGKDYGTTDTKEKQ